MKYEYLKKKSGKEFRRLTGVKRKTFDTMVGIITSAETIKKARGGRPNSLNVENRILMTLEYLREYRTYAHIAASYGLSESNVFENIRWIENILVRSKEFRLPGRKALTKSDYKYEVVLIDATETPIERPKKNNGDTIRAKKRDTL
jgi:hypothetical protein